ncbi:hypothetical protein DPMN_008577 [Dreissena polymorpha]|uniref:Uncharacterized protein n=1 Tax=Dreissena polymorpha TaxID=45954 RepID=A0A9D4RXG5_DREPO|nr:hypothetical protein DPMN_008577 [Dreissena polymorpha]
MRQSDDAKFAECFNRIREGKQTEPDTNLLAGRLNKKGNEDEMSTFTYLAKTVW